MEISSTMISLQYLNCRAFADRDNQLMFEVPSKLKGNLSDKCIVLPHSGILEKFIL